MTVIVQPVLACVEPDRELPPAIVSSGRYHECRRCGMTFVALQWRKIFDAHTLAEAHVARCGE